MPRLTFTLFTVFTLTLLSLAPSAGAAETPFAIQVVDEATGRGVPLVELKTTSQIRFHTDSAGRLAIDDPSLLGRKVFFSLSSHGYEFPADGFGMRGKAVDVKAGASATLKIKRLNVAERLYRTTGEGIYAETVRLGLKPPIDQPLLNAQVTGQDSIQGVVFNGKARWFWGDTNRQSYPLGHFGMACATSDLPGAGGLSPDVGVNLTYFTTPDGFSRGAFEREGNLLYWADGLFVVKDSGGKDHLLAAVSLMKSLTECVGHRLVEWDDETNRFKTIKEFPADGRARPHGHALPVEVDGKKYIYFGDPLPDVRVPATYEAAIDLANYEAYTCITTPDDDGTTKARPRRNVTRDKVGRAQWNWHRGGERISREDFDANVKAGTLQPEDEALRPIDVATNKVIRLHAGSVNWNPHRNKYVMISNQFGGKSSFLGEVYYLEADTPTGPWTKAIKVVTHDRYSFYNPRHHVFFDQDGGRTIYFEGTYCAMFSRQGDETPRYDYNQVMYKLDLDDPRLKAAR